MFKIKQQRLHDHNNIKASSYSINLSLDVANPTVSAFSIEAILRNHLLHIFVIKCNYYAYKWKQRKNELNIMMDPRILVTLH